MKAQDAIECRYKNKCNKREPKYGRRQQSAGDMTKDGG